MAKMAAKIVAMQGNNDEHTTKSETYGQEAPLPR
jgi:hypothetical protein